VHTQNTQNAHANDLNISYFYYHYTRLHLYIPPHLKQAEAWLSQFKFAFYVNSISADHVETKNFWTESGCPPIHTGYREPRTALINKKMPQEMEDKWIVRRHKKM
jgi:hypothetical protein